MHFGVVERLSEFLNVQPFANVVKPTSVLHNNCRQVERNVSSYGGNDDVYMHDIAKNLNYYLN